jgi:HEAT repeat protein
MLLKAKTARKQSNEKQLVVKKLNWITTSRLAALSALSMGIYRWHYVRCLSRILSEDNRMPHKPPDGLIHGIGLLAFARALFLLYYTGFVLYVFFNISQSIHPANAFNQMANAIYSINTTHLIFVVIESLWLVALTSWALMVAGMLNAIGLVNRDRVSSLRLLATVASNVFYINYSIRRIDSDSFTGTAHGMKTASAIRRSWQIGIPLAVALIIVFLFVHQTKIRDHAPLSFDSDADPAKNVDNLIATLKKSNDENARRSAAILMVNFLDDESVRRALMQALSSDTSGKVRIDALWGISKIAQEDKRFIQALIGAIKKNTMKEVRDSALIRFVEMKPSMRRLEKVLLDTMDTPPGDGIKAMAADYFHRVHRISESSIPTLIRLAKNSDYPVVRISALNALSRYRRYSDEVYEALLACMASDKLGRVRGAAAKALPTYSASAEFDVPPLMRAIAQDKDPDFREAAVEALSEYPSRITGALSMLVGLLKTSVHPGVREQACRTLAKAGKKAQTAIPLIIYRLGDDEREVRAAAAWALGKIGKDPELAVPALASALKNDSVGSVRRSAAKAIGRFESRAKVALPILREAMLTDRANRTEIQRAIQRIENQTRGQGVIFPQQPMFGKPP